MQAPIIQDLVTQANIQQFLGQLRQVATCPDSILIQGVTFGHTDIPPILFLGFLHFEGCVFDDTFLISGAGVRGGVQFKDCTLNGTLTLRRCQIASDLSIEGLASTDSANGVLAIDGCEIDGSLSICESSFKRLLVPDVRVAGNIEVRSTTVIHDGSFARAAVSGGMRISQPKGTLSTVKFGELDLQSVRVTGNLSLRGIQVQGVLDLHDGEVGGSVHFKPYFENLRSSSRTCRARLGKLHAPGLRANHSLDLRGLTVFGQIILLDASLRAIHAGASAVHESSAGLKSWQLRLCAEGRIDLTSAKVDTDVDLSGARLFKGIYAPNITVGGAFKLQCRSGSRTYIRGCDLMNNPGTRYSAWLVDANIGGYLSFAGALTECGICLDGINVRGDLYLDSIREKVDGRQPIIDTRLQVCKGTEHPRSHKVKTVGNSAKATQKTFAISMRDATVSGDIHISGLSMLDRTTGVEAKKASVNAGNASNTVGSAEVDFTGSCFRNLYADRDCSDGGDDRVGGYASVNLRLQNILAKGNIYLPFHRSGYVFLDQAVVDGSVVFYNETLDPFSIEKERQAGELVEDVRKKSLLGEDKAAEFIAKVRRLLEEAPDADTYTRGLTLGHVSLRQAHIRGDIDLTARILSKGLDGEQVHVEGDLLLFGTDLDTFSIDYMGSNFSLSLYNGAIEGSLLARGVRASGGIDLAGVKVTGNVDFSTAQRRCMLRSFIGKTAVSKSTWPVTCCLWMRAAQVGGKLLLQGAYLDGGLSLIDSTIHGVVDLSSSYRMTDANAENTNPLSSDDALLIRPTVIHSSRYRPDEEEFSIDLRNATLTNFLRIDNSRINAGEVNLQSLIVAPKRSVEERTLLKQHSNDPEWCGETYTGKPLLKDRKGKAKERDKAKRAENAVDAIGKGFSPVDNDSKKLCTRIYSHINMSGAHIGGLHLKGLIFEGKLRARQLTCVGGFDLFRIYGQSYYKGASRGAFPSPQLDISFSTIGGKVELAESYVGGIQAISSTIKGVFNVSLCYIERARRKDLEFAMRLTACDVNGHLRVRHSVLQGGIALVTSKIRADFHCNDSEVKTGKWLIEEEDDVAIIAHRATIGATVLLSRSVFEGAIDFSNAEVGKDFLARVDDASFVPEHATKDPSDSNSVGKAGPNPGPFFRMTSVKITGRAEFDIESLANGALLNYSSIGEFNLRRAALPQGGEPSDRFTRCIEKASGGQFKPWSIVRPLPPKASDDPGSQQGKGRSDRAISAFGVQWQDFTCAISRGDIDTGVGISGWLCKHLLFLREKVLFDFFWLFAGAAFLAYANWTGGGHIGYAQGLVIAFGVVLAGLLGLELVKLRSTGSDYPYFVGVWIFLECCKFSHGLYLRMTDMFAKMGARNYADCLFVRMRKRELVDRDYSGSFARSVYGTLTNYGTKTRFFTILLFGMFSLCVLSLDAHSQDIYHDWADRDPWGVFTNLVSNSVRQVVEPPYVEPAYWKNPERQVAAAHESDEPDETTALQLAGSSEDSDASSVPPLTPQRDDSGYEFLSRYPLLPFKGGFSIGSGFLILRSIWWLWWALVIAEVFGLLRRFSTEGVQR
jgi:hypothetical protein